MDLQKFFGFVQILKDSIKIINKNGRMMASITTLFFLTYTLFYIVNIFSIIPLISDMVFKLMYLNSIESLISDMVLSLILGIAKDYGLFLVIEIIYFILYLAASLVSLSALVIVSSTYYTGKIFAGKEVFVNAIKSVKRPFLTYFFIILMSIGYMVVFILVIMVPILLFPTYPLALISILIFISILASIIYIGFSVVWVLGIVISVIEKDCYGIQALGKAGKIIKGKRIDGFLLNLGLNLIFLVLYGVLRLIMGKAGVSTSGQIIMGLFMIFFACLVQLLQFSSYTALYFECKKNHGEEIGKYSKIPTRALDEDIP